MSDPRLGGAHLNETRRSVYDVSVGRMLDDRGPTTSKADGRVRPPTVVRDTTRKDTPPPGGTYTLVDLADGRRHQLRVGINTLGRYDTNDIVFASKYVSRRHCVALVHAGGGCEVYDTASMNGTTVNGRLVNRADLLPGDILQLWDVKLLAAWTDSAGELLPPAGAPETFTVSGGPSPTNVVRG